MQKEVKTLVVILLALGSYTGCVLSEKQINSTTDSRTPSSGRAGSLSADEHTRIQRYVASSAEETPYLIYYSAKPGEGGRLENEKIEVISKEIWTEWARRETTTEPTRARRQTLLNFFYANTRLKSNSGLAHAACFTGSATDVRTQFIQPPDQPISGLNVTNVSVSGDETLIGISFRDQPQSLGNRVNKGQNYFLRLPSCYNTGKAAMINENVLTDAISSFEAGEPSKFRRRPNLVGATDSSNRTPAQQTPDVSASRGSWRASTPPGAGAEPKTIPPTLISDASTGYKILDPGPSPYPKELPRFTLRADYDKATKLVVDLAEKRKTNSHLKDEPWLNEIDLNDKTDHEEFALIMQQYAYEGMANQNINDPDQNFITIPELDKPSKRYWCNMPWLNQGPSGREPVHGLTMERDLYPSGQYPLNNMDMTTPLGSDWGVAFFNAVGCETIGKVFGPESNPKQKLVWGDNSRFADGTVIFKILFTTAEAPVFDGAFTWNANVSLPKQTERSIRKIRHIQMDIGIKDSRIKGPANTADGWYMLTYYFDKNYISPLGSRMKGLPEGFKHMRPVGHAWGFTPNESSILPGASTNQVKGTLNGPADNPNSSCMGCHGTAGTKMRMAPGIESASTWMKVRDEALDFGQQFALAKKTIETAPTATPANK